MVWNPYKNSRDHHLLHPIYFFSGCLKCTVVLESYHPERVLKQFDRVYIIPPSPLSPKKVRRGSTVNKYHMSYTWSDSSGTGGSPTHIACEKERGSGVLVGPRLQSSGFMILMITKHMWLFSTNQIQVLSIFQGSRDSRSFPPLKEGIENSRRFKYGIKAQSIQTSLKEKPG